MTDINKSSVDRLRVLVKEALDDMKAEEVVELDVRDKTSVMDYIFVASGTSGRHVRAIANNVAVETKKAGFKPLGVEGEEEGEWVLADLGDIVVHVMQPQVREFYDLESLWRVTVEDRQEA